MSRETHAASGVIPVSRKDSVLAILLLTTIYWPIGAIAAVLALIGELWTAAHRSK